MDERSLQSMSKKLNYIITESQLRFLTEIDRNPGHYDTDPISNLFEFYKNSLSKKERIDSFKDFYKKIFGKKTELKNDEILDYFLSQEDAQPAEIAKKYFVSSFAYYIAKNYFDLKQGIGIQYLVTQDKIFTKDKEYYFFDPQLKIFVGKMYTSKIDLKDKTFYKVQVSATDEELIGTGYGTKMYLTLIDKLDYLASDTTLFSGAYRMWKHVLPKYVNVWGIYEDRSGYGYKFDKLAPGEKKSVRKYDFFIASSKNMLK